MLWFWFGIVALLTLLILAIPLRYFRGSRSYDRTELNKSIYRDRFAEIQLQKEQGILNDEEFLSLDIELKKLLLSDASVKHELDHANKAEIWLYRIILGLLPIISFAVYTLVADWKNVEDWYELRQKNIDFQSSESKDTAWLQELTNQELLLLLRTRLYENPEDTRGWMIFASSLQQLGATEMATQAVERAIETDPNNIALLMNSAQLLMRSKDERYYKVAERLVGRVLLIEPGHEGALAVSGFIARAQGDYSTAIATWKKLISLREHRGEGDGQGVELLRKQIKETELMALQQKHMESAVGQLQVVVALAPELAKSLNPNLTVFVVVRGSDGSPAPVAVKPLKVADLPITLTLSDRDAMMPGRTLSSQKSLQVTARVSFSGTAKPQPGDWESAPAMTHVGAEQPLNVLISQKVTEK